MDPNGKDHPQKERYTPGYRGASRFFSARRGKDYAAFFLSHLKTGMTLLDVGCGPGSITLDLAEAVAPGEAVGVDIAESEVEKARSAATSRGLTNVRFEVASAYQLQFPEASFDAVFSHTMLEHLRDPLAALREMRRVLRKGGVVGIRNGYEKGHVSPPGNPLIEERTDLNNRLIRLNGGDPDFGPKQPGLLREAGFARCEFSASYSRIDPQVLRAGRASMAERMLGPDWGDVVVAQGWASRARVEQLAAAVRAQADDPHLFLFHSYCEAVAWKE